MSMHREEPEISERASAFRLTTGISGSPGSR